MASILQLSLRTGEGIKSEVVIYYIKGGKNNEKKVFCLFKNDAYSYSRRILLKKS